MKVTLPAQTFLLSRKNGLSVVTGICVVILAYIPLAVPVDHWSWLRWKTVVVVCVVTAVLALLTQALMQSKDDVSREGRERQRDVLLARLVEEKEKTPYISSPILPKAVAPSLGQPRLMFAPTQEHGSRWSEQDIFSVNHLDGPAAEFIDIDPIQSARGGNLWLRFDRIPFLDSHHHSAIAPVWMDIGGKRIEATGNIRFVFLRRDANLQNKETVTYPITMRFQSGMEKYMQRFRLIWNDTTQKLSIEPWKP